MSKLPDAKPDCSSLLGYELFAQGREACIENIVDRIAGEGDKTWLACLNPHSYAVAASDVEFDRSLRSADWLVPDGVGMVVASRVLRKGIRARITGWDIFTGVNRALDHRGGLSAFFLGSSEDNLSLIERRFRADYPNLRLAGTYSPPYMSKFGDAENSRILEAVNAARPDVLWVGLTAPKQEKWIHDNLARVDVRFVGAIGAVFDFYSGRVQRPGALAQSLGLEWAVRLAREPRRLWQRTVVSAPRFLFDVARGVFRDDRPVGRR
jgi:N-acetylglucosaminyldiphosphoundecaprenol N-acetyl-beta-D-mannosaminyltransferase